jgi:hypothetical protein
MFGDEEVKNKVEILFPFALTVILSPSDLLTLLE